MLREYLAGKQIKEIAPGYDRSASWALWVLRPVIKRIREHWPDAPKHLPAWRAHRKTIEQLLTEIDFEQLQNLSNRCMPVTNDQATVIFAYHSLIRRLDQRPSNLLTDETQAKAMHLELLHWRYCSEEQSALEQLCETYLCTEEKSRLYHAIIKRKARV